MSDNTGGWGGRLNAKPPGFEQMSETQGRVPRVYRGKKVYKYYQVKACSGCSELCYIQRPKGEVTQRACYCSRSCRLKGSSASNNYNWTGGRKLKRGSHGHPMVYAPEHPHAYQKYVPEHRLIVEKALGRYLTTDECVHHIDMDMSNNNISNLLLMTRKEHLSMHGKAHNLLPMLIKKGLVRFNHTTRLYEAA